MGQIAEVTIESLGGLGDGIATFNSKPLFVPKSCPNDRLKVRIVHHNHQGYQGVIQEIIEPGPARIVPPCPHFTECGGCTLQQLSPAAYRAFKTRMLHSALKQAGSPDETAEVTFIGENARRRVEFHLTPEKKLGFHALRSNQPHAVERCLLLEPALEALIAPLNVAMSAWPAVAYIKSVSLTLADSGVDMVIALRQGNPKPLPVIASMPDIVRMSLRHPDGSLQIVEEHAPVTLRLGGYDIALPPDCFLQATRQGQELLTQFAFDSCRNATRVADLFCGIGTYGIPLSQSADVIALEQDSAMVKALQENVRQCQIRSLTVQQRDLFNQPLTASELRRFDAAIINPPRAGAKAQTQQLAQSGIPTIVMISCNPATFARDARIIAEAGYRLEKAQGIDQFVYSAHLEIAALFRL